MLVVCALAATAGAAPRGVSPPNILLIIADDQAWGDYGFMGHPSIRTPSLDRLAARGRLFPRGYVPSSLCCPSLASILTGQYPHENGITSNDPPLFPSLSPLLRNARTRALRAETAAMIDRAPSLPRLLGTRGYRSFQTGKWWQGHFSHGGFTEGMSLGDPERGGRHGDEGLKIGRESLEPIESFIRRSRSAGAPFFVWYAPMLPHQPHDPPERLLARYRGLTPSLAVARYWAMCEWLDETVGRLTNFLSAEGLERDTIVAFVADNGWIQQPAANTYAPRSKQSPYEGGIRTPIIVSWPGHLSAARSDTPVLSIDLAPTLLRMAGISPPDTMRGVDLRSDPAIRGRKAIFGECFTHNAVDIYRPASSLRWRWTVRDRWKLIVPAPQNERGPVELYDLVADPREEVNQASARPDVVRRLQTGLNAWWDGGQ